MPASREGELSLIVLEQHAKWPACATQYQSATPNSLIEAQTEGESPSEFAERVGRRIASSASKGRSPRVAIIAANQRLDTETLQARYRLAKDAVAAMGLSGELVLSASHSIEEPEADRVRYELFALAGALCDANAGTEISVSVRFPEVAERSGLRPSLHKVAADTDSAASG
jgi:hypothetical protein